jgi:hypothetical protein
MKPVPVATNGSDFDAAARNRVAAGRNRASHASAVAFSQRWPDDERGHLAAEHLIARVAEKSFPQRDSNPAPARGDPS